MITLTKLNGTEFVLNCDLIETIYENPDTTIHLTDGPLYIVRESKEEVVKRAVAYHRETLSNIIYKGYAGEKDRRSDEGEGN
ncbi:MAG: flagellar FlbD family protein [Angelakisella sp.]